MSGPSHDEGFPSYFEFDNVNDWNVVTEGDKLEVQVIRWGDTSRYEKVSVWFDWNDGFDTGIVTFSSPASST